MEKVGGDDSVEWVVGARGTGVSMGTRNGENMGGSKRGWGSFLTEDGHSAPTESLSRVEVTHRWCIGGVGLRAVGALGSG